MKLVIVESPTKAKTITRFLPKEYKVKSSFGHVRDLPKGEMGVDIEHNFKPTYVVSEGKEKQVATLKKVAKGADEILFATDHDREGEAISWHLANLLGVEEKKIKRITFHEITKRAIEEALRHPKKLDHRLVDAQQARRILDRLVGYKLSPFLWKKVARGLSAGRVQSVAVRLIVEREREIKAFKPDEYWTIEGLFDTKEHTEKHTLEGKLTKIDNDKLEKLSIKDEKKAREIEKACKDAKGEIVKIEEKSTTRNPNPPFRTSTLQQAAHSAFGYSAKQIMRLSQQLYEGIDIPGEGHLGLITYMRTDSVNLSSEFINESVGMIKKAYGDKYASQEGRTYSTKQKTAQEAHEAIRPTHVDHTPESLKTILDPQQWKIYDLIWRRAVASQMASAKAKSTRIDIDVNGEDEKKYTFHTTGMVIEFDGFLKLYPEQLKDRVAPPVKEGQKVDTSELTVEQHFTEPPPRYNDASLVKVLEEHEIGRPSTYAPTIGTIEDRGYVERLERKRFQPTDIGELVTDVLVEHFPKIVDYEFTAKMEKQLDEIAEGKEKWQPIIKEFYEPFEKNLEKKTKEVQKKDLVTEETDKICPECSKPILIRLGRYGKFYGCSGYPECKHTEPLEEDKEKAKPKSTGIPCPECSGMIVERKTRRGKLFFGCDKFPKCEYALWNKPTGEKCPDCGQLLGIFRKTKLRCKDKECGFIKDMDNPES